MGAQADVLFLIVYWLRISWMLESDNDENSGVVACSWLCRSLVTGRWRVIRLSWIAKAERISREMMRAWPDDTVRVLSAWD